nr:hypothetical protein KitaXyl93_05810 [Kitasatospora sp. Xyl93]
MAESRCPNRPGSPALRSAQKAGRRARPGLYVMPSARDWAAIPSWEWHKVGVDPGLPAAVLRADRLAPPSRRPLS